MPDNHDHSLHPCARCARMRKTCCQRAEILVTEGDIARIARIARFTSETDFVELRTPSDPEYLDDDPDDHNWKRLTLRSDGVRRVLKRQPSGDCVFHTNRGCRLPENVRPLVCHLYAWT